MTKIQILEREVKKLDRASLMAFREWFRRFDSAAWDRQIERETRAGKLESLTKEAIAEYKAGKTREI